MRRTTRALGSKKETRTSKLGKLKPGITLQDRYLILGVLGSGGMSSVYKGRDLHFPNVTKLVAVKEMINLAADPTMYEMVIRNFEREADQYAAEFFQSKNLQPVHLANILERLEQEFGDKDATDSFLSTHPLTKERVNFLTNKNININQGETYE